MWLCTRRAWIAEPLKVSRRLAVDELPLPRPTPPRRNTRDTHARGNRDLAPAPHARHAEPRQRRAVLSAHAAWPPLDTAAAGRRRRRRRWRRRCTGRRGANSRLLRRVHVERGEPRLRPVRRRRAEPPLPTRSAPPTLLPGVVHSLETTDAQTREKRRRNRRRDGNDDDDDDDDDGSRSAPNPPVLRLVRRAASYLRLWHIGTNSHARSLRAYCNGGGSCL